MAYREASEQSLKVVRWPIIKASTTVAAAVAAAADTNIMQIELLSSSWFLQ